MLWGRETLTVPTDLGTWSTPAWLTTDLLLLDLWREYQDTLCPGCGDPVASHAGKTYHDYASAAFVCPAQISLDKAQTQQAKRDGLKDAKTNPERARTWVTGSRDFISRYTGAMKALLTPKEG